MFEDARTLRERAQAKAAQGNWAAAVDEYRRLLGKEPGDLAARQKLAEGLARLGRTAESVEEYEGVIRAYAVDGMLLKAMALCKHALQLDPSRTAVQAMLVELTTRKRGGPAPEPVVDAAELVVEEESAPIELPRLETPPPPAPVPPDPARVRVSDVPEVVLDLRKVPYIPLFSDLSPAQFAEVFTRMEVRSFATGDVVMREGEPGEAMYIIVQGKVDVQRPGRLGKLETVASLREGACFGEMALVANAPRLATVVVVRDAVLFELSRGAFADITAHHPVVATVAERFCKTRLLHNVLRASPVFRPLGASEQEKLVNSFQWRHVAAGEELMRQGRGGDGLHILLRGRCEASSRRADGETDRYPEMREGDVFGEISLFMGTQATATVRSTTPCELLTLPVAAFDTLVRPNAEVASALMSLGEARLRRMGLEVELDIGAG